MLQLMASTNNSSKALLDLLVGSNQGTPQGKRSPSQTYQEERNDLRLEIYEKERLLSPRELHKWKKSLFSVYVGRLPTDVTVRELVQLFIEVGVPKDVFVVPPEGNNSHTYGFLRFATLAEARKAVACINGRILGNRHLLVEISSETRANIADKGELEVCDARDRLLRKEYPSFRRQSLPDNEEDFVQSKLLQSIAKLKSDQPSIVNAGCEDTAESNGPSFLDKLEEILKKVIKEVPGETTTRSTADEGPVCTIRIEDTPQNSLKTTQSPVSPPINVKDNCDVSPLSTRSRNAQGPIPSSQIKDIKATTNSNDYVYSGFSFQKQNGNSDNGSGRNTENTQQLVPANDTMSTGIIQNSTQRNSMETTQSPVSPPNNVKDNCDVSPLSTRSRNAQGPIPSSQMMDIKATTNSNDYVYSGFSFQKQNGNSDNGSGRNTENTQQLVPANDTMSTGIIQNSTQRNSMEATQSPVSPPNNLKDNCDVSPLSTRSRNAQGPIPSSQMKDIKATTNSNDYVYSGFSFRKKSSNSEAGSGRNTGNAQQLVPGNDTMSTGIIQNSTQRNSMEATQSPVSPPNNVKDNCDTSPLSTRSRNAQGPIPSSQMMDIKATTNSNDYVYSGSGFSFQKQSSNSDDGSGRNPENTQQLVPGNVTMCTGIIQNSTQRRQQHDGEEREERVTEVSSRADERGNDTRTQVQRTPESNEKKLYQPYSLNEEKDDKRKDVEEIRLREHQHHTPPLEQKQRKEQEKLPLQQEQLLLKQRSVHELQLKLGGIVKENERLHSGLPQHYKDKKTSGMYPDQEMLNLEKSIHNYEVEYQREMEIGVARNAEQELLYEREKLSAAFDTNLQKELDLELKMEMLKNEIKLANMANQLLVFYQKRNDMQ